MKKVDLSLENEEFFKRYGRRKTIAALTLGCKVNQYETQAIKERFRDKGYEVIHDADQGNAEGAAEQERLLQTADVFVINTCTVTSLSDRKSRQYIRRAKKKNPDAVIAVIGCFAQVSPGEAAAIEGVNIVAGTNEKHHLPELIEAFVSDEKQVIDVKDWKQLSEFENIGAIVSMDSRVRAFIKIQEGCDKFCSYCMIPYARGQARSRRLSDIIREAEKLIETGIKELVLTGINTALYETPQGDLQGVEAVIAGLNALEGDFRIRLSSLEPTVINAEYIKRLFKYEKLCPHMHLSLQSGSDRVLQEMNRHYTAQSYMDIVSALKAHDPGYGISTDIIAGFPGEREADFLNSIRLVKEAEFCKIHVFKYSKRKGTKAADMKNQIPADIKNLRSQLLIEEGEKAAAGFFKKNIGSVRTVLIEECTGEARNAESAGQRAAKPFEGAAYYTGYTENYIKVYIPMGAARVNTFWKVKLTDVYADGMLGELYLGV